MRNAEAHSSNATNTTSSHSQNTSSLHSDEEEYHDALRPITMEDLIFSMNKMKDSKVHCGSILPMARIDLD